MAKVLLGFMGVGKSSVAPYLDGRFVDMDQVIEEKIGMRNPRKPSYKKVTVNLIRLISGWGTKKYAHKRNNLQ